MYFKLQNLSMDLGDTPIENIFINDFMPTADGNFVKVYLMGYKLAKESRGLKSYDSTLIADLLGIIESDVIRAWDYWEKMGIVNKVFSEDKEQFNIEFVNLKELYIKNIYTASNPSVKKRDQNSILDDPKIANLLSQVDKLMMGRLSIPQKQDIAKWRDVYNMPTELIFEAFDYSVNIKNINTLNYIESVVRNWSIDNIRTKEALEESIREHDEKYARFLIIKDRIGIGLKPYTKVDFDTVNSWFDDYNMDMDLVLHACDKCINIKNPNLGYVNRIISNWHNKGIKKIEDIPVLDTKPEIKKAEVKNKFHNFKQLSDNYDKDYLESIAREKRQKLFDELGD